MNEWKEICSYRLKNCLCPIPSTPFHIHSTCIVSDLHSPLTSQDMNSVSFLRSFQRNCPNPVLYVTWPNILDFYSDELLISHLTIKLEALCKCLFHECPFFIGLWYTAGLKGHTIIWRAETEDCHCKGTCEESKSAIARWGNICTGHSQWAGTREHACSNACFAKYGYIL
jgi:hypothetical protein